MNKHFLIYVLVATLTLLVSSVVCAGTRVVINEHDDFVKVFAGINTNYIIKGNIDLGEKTIRMGSGCTLVFQGGSLSNGTIVGNNTRIKAGNYEIFKRGYIRYRAFLEKGTDNRYPPTLLKVYHNCIVIEGTWNNLKCHPNWTGLLNQSNEDVMLAVKNYVALHKEGTYVKIPCITALGYEQTKLPGNHIIDFNNSSIDYPDNLTNWEDNTIAMPSGAIQCPLESGYGLITLNNNTTVSNLSIDAKSNFRQEEKKRLGVSNIICIGNSQNVRLKNVNISNVLGPAMVAHPKSKNVSFYKCSFKNIDEHILYSQQYLGFCRFEKCLFDTWDSERLSVFRDGLNYIYKHTPPVDNEDVTYNEVYSFELSFRDCVFNNPKRVNSQGRILGGFLTGTFPVLINVENCVFKGEFPVLNPGGSSVVSEKTGKTYRMIVRDCTGTPVVYPSKSNYNIITEFYNCKEIPFRVVYAKRYENCDLYIDLYEDNIENVSSSYVTEFSTPLVIKDCEFIDRGNNVKINHPLFHRPVIFEDCELGSDVKRGEISDIVTVRNSNISSLSFCGCTFSMPGFRLVGGNNRINRLSIRQCSFFSIEKELYNCIPQEIDFKNNLF